MYLFCISVFAFVVFRVLPSESASCDERQLPSFQRVSPVLLDNIQTGTRLHRSKAKAPIYLECTFEGGFPGLSLERGFSVKLHPEFNPDAVDSQTHHREIGILTIKIYENTCRITGIHITPLYQKKGYGLMAIQTLVNSYKAPARQQVPFSSYQAEVEKTNGKAQRMFQNAGFTITDNTQYENYDIWVFQREPR
jgi:ribosomal protein S18 acetylase RimI-like enzyme